MEYIIGKTNVFMEVRSISRAELELGFDTAGLSASDVALASSFGGMRPFVASVLAADHGGHVHSLAGPSVGGTPVVLGHVLPRGVLAGDPGVVQGSAVDAD